VRILLTIVVKKYGPRFDEVGSYSRVFSVHSGASDEFILEALRDYVHALKPNGSVLVSISHCVLA
jgi:hypothetical protein